MIIRLHYISNVYCLLMVMCNHHHISITIISNNKYKSSHYNCWGSAPLSYYFYSDLTIRLKRINNESVKDANNIFVDPS